MIRRRLRRRWYEQLPPPRDGAALLCSFWELDHWKWLDRYFAWDVATFGEVAGAAPLWDRMFGRFACWLADWRTTLALRFGREHLGPGKRSCG